MKYPRVSDIRTIETRGPWLSKSGGVLSVQFALSPAELAELLDTDNPEFDKVTEESGVDIRGLRVYKVSDIPDGSIGGNEWHRARTEVVSTLGGRALWHCEDIYGGRSTVELDGTVSVVQPPGIMHTYEARANGTTLQVVCNTLYVPEDPRTYDTYSREAFNQLVEEQAAHPAEQV